MLIGMESDFERPIVDHTTLKRHTSLVSINQTKNQLWNTTCILGNDCIGQGIYENSIAKWPYRYPQ